MNNRILKIITLLGLILTAFGAHAQTVSTISGYVTDPNTGFALNGHPVEIEYMDTSNAYSNIVLTNANGWYVDSIIVPANATADYKVSVFDSCNNATYIDSFVNAQSLMTAGAQIDFQVCTPGSGQGPNCDAGFSATLAPNLPPTGPIVYNMTADVVHPDLDYEWSIDGQVVGTSSSLTHTMTASLHQVCLSVTSNNPAIFCMDTECDSIVDIQTPGPGNCDAQLTILNKVGLNIDLQDNSNSTTGNHNVTWYMGDGTVYNGASVSHTYNQGGTYTIVHIIDDSACVDSNFVVMTFNGTGTGSGNNNCFASFQAFQTGTNTVTFFNGSNNGINGNTASATIDFGDGSSASIGNAAVSHTYNSPGMYGVCLTVATTSGCTDTYCDTVQVQGPVSQPVAYNLSGMVYTATPNALMPVTDARVYLIQYDSTANTLTAVDSVDLTMPDSGFYSFTANPGQYYIKAAALPSSSQYNSHLPTYYGNSTQWLYATAIQLTGNNLQTGYDIHLIAGNNPGGPGFIGGTLQSGANKVTDTDISVEDVEVVVYDAATGELVDFVRSDANGDFSFASLPYGTYRLHAEVLGVVTQDRIITLDANTPSANDEDITLDEGTTNRNAALAASATMRLYPNPTAANVSLQIASDQAGTASITILDATGRAVYRHSVRISGTQVLELPTADLPNGLYHTAVRLNGTQQHFKLVVQH